MRSGKVGWKRRGRLTKSKQTLDGYIFIEQFPMDAEAAADKAPILSFLGARILQPGKPLQRNRDLSPIGKRDLQDIRIKHDIYSKRLYIGG